MPKHAPTLPGPRAGHPGGANQPQRLSSRLSLSSLSAMSGLARDAAAFKSALHRQDYSSWHSQPPPLQPQQAAPPPTSDSDSSKKKKRPKSSTSLLLDESVLGFNHG